MAGAPNRNTAWARVLLDELARAGLRIVTFAPGSRSTPLVLAAERHDDLATAVHVDERSAAFHALGVGKATGMPAAVVITSGTAAANLHPAVVEAATSETPLLALTADRPHELRGTDANQTIDQVKLYGDAVRAFHELPPPEIEPDALRHLRTLADRVVAQARGAPAGPVHVNCPFAKPLEPTPVEGDVPATIADDAPLAASGRPGGAPFTRVSERRAAPETSTTRELAEALEAADRPLIVAGPTPRPDRLGPAAVALAQATGAPLLADPLSGARFTPGAPDVVLGHGDLFLRSDPLREALTPDLVVRLAASPTSKRVSTWLAEIPEVRQIVVDEGDRLKDHQHAASELVRADPALTCRALADAASSTPPKAWTAPWQEAETRTRTVLDEELANEPFEATALATAASTVPEGGQLLVGNSMPVRDLDAFARPRDAQVHVLGNRGASGIDGLVSTAIGAAQATERPTLAVLGDLSFLHDVNGLHALRDVDAPITFLVVNNDGGGIFHRLPIREHADFTRCFATPHGRDLRHATELHDLEHRPVDDAGQLAEPLDTVLSDPQGQVVELASDRASNHARHEAVHAQVQAAVEAIPDR